MTILEEGLKAYLAGFAGLAALVTANRIYPGRMKQGSTLPCVVYNRISTSSIQAHDSTGIGGDLSFVRMQFDSWADTALAAKGVADQIRAALNGKKGTVNGITLQGVLAGDERFLPDPDPELYHYMSEFIIPIVE